VKSTQHRDLCGANLVNLAVSKKIQESLVFCRGKGKNYLQMTFLLFCKVFIQALQIIFFQNLQKKERQSLEDCLACTYLCEPKLKRVS
jgi:hypothetical protein